MSRNRKSRKAHKKRLDRKPTLQKLDDRKLMAADTPFSGDGILYQIHGHNEQGQLSTIDVANGEFNNVGDAAGYKINATGYRVSDDFIYGIKKQDDSLVRISATGDVTNLGKIDGLPDKSYFSADFADDGLLYLWTPNKLYAVNVDDVAVEKEVPLSRKMKSTPDLAFNPDTGLMYGVENTRNTAFVSIDVDTGEVTTIDNHFNSGTKGLYGAMFADANGRIFAANNRGGLYEVDASTGEATYAGFSPRASTNDGSSPSTASMNLPPVALDHVMSTSVGASDVSLGLQAPVDLEGDTMTISITELPAQGTVTYADGTPVNLGDSLTSDQLTSLLYDAPESLSNSDPSHFVYSVSDGASSTSATASILLDGKSSLHGQVYIQNDNDDNAYEAYAFNNEITLTGTTLSGAPVSLTTQSDIEGLFSFDDLDPGTYTLTQAQPDIVKEAFAEAGELGGTVGTNVIAEIVIPSGSGNSYEGYDFHEYAPSSLSGFVHVDEDSDGELDGSEAGVQNVTMTLSGTNDLGEEVTMSTVTDINGLYEFTGLRPGDYSVNQVQPGNYIDSAANAGSEDGAALSANLITDIALSAGTVATHYDFGELSPTSISGNVYLDNDFDGVLDRGDSPIENITIELTGVDLDGNSVQMTTETDEDGKYRFDLLPGTYTVQQTEQPTGLLDGRDNLGNFIGQSGVIARNGVRGNDIFTEIELHQGESGVGYNFGERLVYELLEDSDFVLEIVGTDADDDFEFIAGTTTHQVFHNSELIHELDASKTHEVLFIGNGGKNTVRMTGTEDVESVRLRPTSADYHARTFRVTSSDTSEATIFNGGGFDRLFMYDSEGDDRLRATQTYAMMTGEGFSNIGYGFHRTYSFSTRGGTDIATLTDSKKDDTFRASSTNARMFGRDYYNNVRSFERVYAKAVHGGNDTAVLWDSEANGDIFHSTPDYARMYNSDYYNFSTGFDTVTAYANQGGTNDRAYFKDTPNDDIIVSTQTETGISTSEYTHAVRQFERMQAFSTGGSDRAYLYDSKLDDKFRALPTYATLYNSEYYLKVNNFAQVDAYSSGGGNDRAYFYDSAGDDTYVSMENEVRMFGDGFDNTSHGFQRSYAFATSGGNDRAIMYDGDLADSVKVSGDMTRMYGPGYYNRVEGFNELDIVFSDLSNQDRAMVFGGVSESTLNLAGDLASHMSENSSAYVYGSDVVAEMEGSDNVSGDTYAAPGEDGDVWDIAIKDF